jgi:chromosome segregation ATPase
VVNCEKATQTPYALDLLMLDADEMLPYAQGLQADVRSLRETLHEAVAALHRAQIDARRYEHRIWRLVDQIQELTAERANLRRQLTDNRERRAA